MDLDIASIKSNNDTVKGCLIGYLILSLIESITDIYPSEMAIQMASRCWSYMTLTQFDYAKCAGNPIVFNVIQFSSNFLKELKV